MSKPVAVKRATLKKPSGEIGEMFLTRREKGDFRWVTAKTGSEWDGVAYLSESDAVKALRVDIDGGPEYVGWDLTIYPVDPPPDVRCSYAIVKKVCGRVDDQDRIAEVIREETRIDELLDAYQALLAYCFTRRPANKEFLEQRLALQVGITANDQRLRDVGLKVGGYGRIDIGEYDAELAALEKLYKRGLK